jgi:hypothetical protein
MTCQTPKGKDLFRLILVPALAAGLTVGCSSSSSGGGSGGKSGSGGASSGGTSAAGGSNNGGNASGGTSAKGGSSGSGGSNNGGNASGGTSAKGGAAGSNNGGSSSGGSAGSNAGGSSAGGNSAGGNSGGAAGAAGGSSAGGNSAGGNSAGGAAGSSGAGGAAGGSGTPASGDLKCDDPWYGSVNIPAAAIIADFENNSLMPYASEGRAAGSPEGWRGWATGTASANPETAPNVFKIDTSVHGPCSSKGALHVTSSGPSNSGDSVAVGIDVMGRTSDNKKQSWDASKYTGVGFWAKCSADLPFTFFKTVDANQDGDMPSPTCSYSNSPKCVQHGVKNSVITKDWTYIKLYFDQVLQDPNGGTFDPKAFDKSKFVAFQMLVNPFSPRSGAPSANKFDCYLDDVHFLSEEAPKPAAETVTWSVEGTKIKRNGSEYKIRGLVRPSMEWDCAGFGVTREDARRIKAWHPNAVRLAVKDTLWNGAGTGSATCNGAAYQNQVKRAINWYFEQKLDVILDLHYVGDAPKPEHTTFWDTISKDPFFKNEGRIIFELYNEPSSGDFTSLRGWMNTTIAKIRANEGSDGKRHLILASGLDWTYDLSGYVGAGNGVTDSANATAYAVHPYIFKPKPDAWKDYCAQLPVVATEFGDANLVGQHTIDPGQCDNKVYENYISSFESIGMSWTSWAWIVDEWGCGFPQLIQDWSGTPNAIGTPVKDQLTKLNKTP